MEDRTEKDRIVSWGIFIEWIVRSLGVALKDGGGGSEKDGKKKKKGKGKEDPVDFTEEED